MIKTITILTVFLYSFMSIGRGQNPPDWQDDPGCCEFISFIVGGIVQNNGVNLAE